jgi:hypothetical protein
MHVNMNLITFLKTLSPNSETLTTIELGGKEDLYYIKKDEDFEDKIRDLPPAVKYDILRTNIEPDESIKKMIELTPNKKIKNYKGPIFKILGVTVTKEAIDAEEYPHAYA